MTCKHKRVWEMELSSNRDEERRVRLLEDGWEPYAVSPETDVHYACSHFRRLKPCEECGDGKQESYPLTLLNNADKFMTKKELLKTVKTEKYIDLCFLAEGNDTYKVYVNGKQLSTEAPMQVWVKGVDGENVRCQLENL